MDLRADLNNCDREPIHIPGKIQSHGVLFGFDSVSKLVTHVSANCEMIFGSSPAQLLNRPVDEILSKIDFDDRGIEVNEIGNFFSAFGVAKESSPIVKCKNGNSYHFITHTSGPTTIIELELVLTEKVQAPEPIVSGLLTKILEAKTLKETLDFSAGQIKKIIGYNRVMIYKFLEDGHGEVVAEVVDPGYDSFDGLHFPASDIPKQARELYKKNLVRIIGDVHSTDTPIEVNSQETAAVPLDLSDSVLRAVSPIHIQYLKNMGVKASFSVSILSKGELWGLIACHHYEARQIDFRKRNNCKIIGQLVSTSVTFRQEEENKEQKSFFSESLSSIIRGIRNSIEIAEALTGKFSANLLDITRASGAALLYDGKMHLLGQTPGKEQIISLSKQLGARGKNLVFQTSNLSGVFPEAAAYKEVASGLMSCALSKELNEYIFWFKKEARQSIKWAGNPDKPMETDASGMQTLGPRRSFDVWVSEVLGASEPWTSNEISSAMKLREEIVQIINERANQIRKLNDQLKRAYDELDTFSYTISHDLKNPLASIRNYSELLLEGNSEVDTKFILSRIVKSTERMNNLINEVLAYSKIGREVIEPRPIVMNKMVEEIKAELENVYKQKTNIRVSDLPELSGDHIMLSQAFSNIIGNAVKYSAKQADPLVVIDATVSNDAILYSIADNGIGIDMKHGDSVFELFRRMDNATEFEGTGVGLAIVKRIIEKHNAIIWYESETGKGTTFYLKFKIN